MERVQFQQEQMLQELKDLVEKNLFTEREVKQIVKKRTTFETALVRRVAKKADFLRYASYEMSLEHLRRKRADRLQLKTGPATLSDYALVRRQFHIFERAVKKFKSDVGLWIQYIQVAKQQGARSLVGRITARALQLHPNKPALYILAAAHELDHHSPSAARSLLQRGIRMNSESIELWREYVKMELGFVESLRRRWEVLGIKDLGNEDKGKSKSLTEDPSDKIMGYDVTSGNDGGSVIEGEDVVMDGDEGAAARQQIMEGAIVKSVITSASQALHKIELFQSLNTLLIEYPVPDTLRQTLLDHLYDVIREKFPGDPEAMALLAGRFLIGNVTGEQLVENIRLANEEMLLNVGDGRREDTLQAYAKFIELWCGKLEDATLKHFLIASLQSLIQRVQRSPSLMSTHIKLLITNVALLPSPSKVLEIAQKYTKRLPKSSSVWLARLSAESHFGGNGGDLERIWREARQSATGTEEEIRKVWSWGLVHEGPSALEVHELLLKESMGDSRLYSVHEGLVLSYVTVLHEAHLKPTSELTSDQTPRLSANWMNSIRRMGREYLTTGRVWNKVFTINCAAGTSIGEVQEVYEYWRAKEGAAATLGWARYLVTSGKGREATEVIVRAGSLLGEEERREVEQRWIMDLDDMQ